MVDTTAPFYLVDSPSELQTAIGHLLLAPRLGLDTEFHAEHRYRPELMLVQIAEPDGTVWIFDPRAVSLAPLAEVVTKVPLVVHGGTQDLLLLHRVTRARPATVFDTQRAAAFLGLGFPTRLGVLARQGINHTMDKGAALTDWSQRPLDSRQLQYAAEDARVLLPLASALEASLEEQGRLAWALAACQEGVEEALADLAEGDAWLSWDIAWQLDAAERRAMHALFRWREATGRATDQQPRQVLSDALTLDLARRRPRTITEMSENRRIPQGLLRRQGAPLLEALQRANDPNAPAPCPPSPELLLLAQTLELWASVVEGETGIARSLALPRALALRVAQEGAGACTGWRAELLEAGLRRVLNGQEGLALERMRLTRISLSAS